MAVTMTWADGHESTREGSQITSDEFALRILGPKNGSLVELGIVRLQDFRMARTDDGHVIIGHAAGISD